VGVKLGAPGSRGFGLTWDRNASREECSYQVNGLAMMFDSMNRTVEMQTGSGYQQILYTATGQKFAMMNGQTLQKYFVPLAAGVQVVYNSSGLQYYRHADWLGSSRMALDTNGNLYSGRAYAPFGETYAETGTADRSFTGQTQDVIAGPTGIYDFLFRQHSAAQGRWLVPDPAGLAAVDITNPQTWNRYAYVANNPLNGIDPLGLKELCPGKNGKPEDCDPVFRFGPTDLFGEIGSLSVLTTAFTPIPGGGSNPEIGSGFTNIGMLTLLGSDNLAGYSVSLPGTASAAKNGNYQSTGTTSIISGNVTTNAPTIAAGAAVGEAIGGPPGAFLGGIIGNFFGVGGTASYVPSTKSLYAGPTLVFAPALGGGNGFSANVVSVPSSQNPNSIANGLSYSVTFQPLPFLGSTVVKSPGSGPAVVGSSVGTRIPVSFGVSFNFPLKKGGC